MAPTSVCVVRDDGKAFRSEPAPVERLHDKPEHSRELLPELERLLRQARAEWRDIQSLAVGVGPGTFTGLRIGVATARALAQGLGIGIRRVSSLEALAAGVVRGVRPGAGRPVVATIDARRGQVFCAAYLPRDEGRPDLEALRPPAVLDPEDLLALVTDLDAPICAGDWAVESRADLESAGADVPQPESGLHAVDAFFVCALAKSVEPVAPGNVYPVYLRLPDAEVNRQLARGNVHETEAR
jgi:tRNA threonylcarbamoyladenosine biosynthesis protein TsaB